MSVLTALSLCPPVTGIFLPNPCHSQTDTNNKTGNFLVSEKFRKHSTTDEIFPLCSEIVLSMGNILKFRARVGINGMVEIRIFETICKCCLWGPIVSISLGSQLFCVDWTDPSLHGGGPHIDQCQDTDPG